MADVEFSTRGGEKVVKTTEEIVGANKKLLQLEQQIERQTETAQEKYIRKMAEARKALAGNAKETELLARYEAKLRKEYEDTVGITKKKQDAETALANEKRRASAEAEAQQNKYQAIVQNVTRSQMTEYDKLKEKIGTIETAFNAVGGSQDKMKAAITAAKIEHAKLVDSAKALKTEWVDLTTTAKQLPVEADKTNTAFAAIAQHAGKFLSVGAAIGFITSALRELAAERERLAQEAKSAVVDEMGLAQFVESPTKAGAEKEFQALLGESREWSAAMGVSRQEAAGIFGGVVAAGVKGEDRDLFRDLRSTGLVRDPGQMALAAETLRSSMGVEEAGSYRDLVSKSLAASKDAPGEASQILTAAARGGTSARALGLRDEEVLAATARLSIATGTTEVGGTQVAALLKSLDQARSGKNPLKGGTLEEMIAEVSTRVAGGEDIRKLLGGRQEAINAYRVLADAEGRAGYRGTLSDIDAAAAQDLVGTRLGLAGVDPSISSARTAMSNKQGRSVTPEALTAGADTNTVQAARDRAFTDMGPGFATTVGEKIAQAIGFFIPDSVEKNLYGDPSAPQEKSLMEQAADRLDREEEAKRQRKEQLDLQREQLKAAQETNRKLEDSGITAGGH